MVFRLTTRKKKQQQSRQKKKPTYSLQDRDVVVFNLKSTDFFLQVLVRRLLRPILLTRKGFLGARSVRQIIGNQAPKMQRIVHPMSYREHFNVLEQLSDGGTRVGRVHGRMDARVAGRRHGHSHSTTKGGVCVLIRRRRQLWHWICSPHAIDKAVETGRTHMSPKPHAHP